MTDEQFKAIQRLVLDLGVEIGSLRREFRQYRELQDYRFKLLYAWLAPDDYKHEVETLPELIEVPEDLKKFFPD